jgi:hypothetical protein
MWKTISSPTELYAKIAEKVRKETLALQVSTTGMPPPGTTMTKVKKKKKKTKAIMRY